MNQALRTLFRLVFCLWTAAILLCGAVVAWKTASTEQVGSLLTFLFTKEIPLPSSVLVPWHSKVIPTPEPLPEPTPEPVPAEVKIPQPPVIQADYPLLPRGKTQGKGRLQTPKVQTLEDGRLEVRLTYTGQLGAVTSIAPSGQRFCSVDVHGAWNRIESETIRPQDGLFSVIQIGYHDTYIRISAVCKTPDSKKRVSDEVRYSPTEVIIRFRVGEQPRAATQPSYRDMPQTVHIPDTSDSIPTVVTPPAP